MWDLIVSVPDHCLSFYFVQYYDKNWHSCQSMWVIQFWAWLQTHGNKTNSKIESHNQKLKNYLTKLMHLPKLVNNSALFIAEAFTISSYTRYSNLKTKIGSCSFHFYAMLRFLESLMMKTRSINLRTLNVQKQTKTTK